MRNSLILAAVTALAVVAPAGSRLAAQSRDVTGTWQGLLQAPEGARREVIRIAADGKSLSAVLYSIDQGTGPFAGAVVLQDAGISISFPSLSATYAARLATDGTAIEGTWSRNGQTLTLNLKHATAQETWVIPVAAPPRAMAADANPAFEAATIKPSKPGAPGGGIQVRGRQLTTLNTTVAAMIAFSYRLQAKQIVGAPAWLDQNMYDILARPDGEGQPSDRQWRGMIQKLLADRFQLAFHREKKALPVYAITLVDKAGAKLTKSAADPASLPTLGLRALGDLVGTNASIDDFAQFLEFDLDRPAVDHTGLSGRFDFALRWTLDPAEFGGRGAAAPPSNDPAAPPGIFTAVQEQLGLRLESTKADVDVLVIDHVERPSED